MESELSLESNLRNHLHKTLAKRGIIGKNYYVKAKTDKGDGFIALISKVKVELENNEDLYLVLKMEPKNKKKKEEYQTEFIFRREIYLYETFLPEVRRLILSKEDVFDKSILGKILITPKYLGAMKVDEELIMILEDVEVHGYEMSPKRIMLGYEFCKKMIGTIAGFHACSFAVEDQFPVRFEEMKSAMTSVFIEQPFYEIESLINDRLKQSIKDLTPRFDPGSKYLKKLEEFKPVSYKTIIEDTKKFKNDKYGVITHGDCWVNNMMFKSSQDGEIEKICLIDFQLSGWGPVVFDVYMCLFLGADTSIIPQLPELVDFYYKCLEDSIRLLGSDPEKVYPKEVYQDQLKRFMKHCFIFTLSFLHILASDSDSLPDIHDDSTDDYTLQSLKHHKCENQEYVINHLKTILMQLVDNDWL